MTPFICIHLYNNSLLFSLILFRYIIIKEQG
nr:MAG TPA: hypothetical protein [Caudoviricetes sp.]